MPGYGSISFLLQGFPSESDAVTGFLSVSPKKVSCRASTLWTNESYRVTVGISD